MLSVCVPRTYQLIKSLLAPDNLATKTFREIVELMKNHFQPKPSQIMEQFNFHPRDSMEGETMAMYVTELKKLSE